MKMYESWQQILNSFNYCAVTITIGWKYNIYIYNELQRVAK